MLMLILLFVYSSEQSRTITLETSVCQLSISLHHLQHQKFKYAQVLFELNGQTPVGDPV